MRLRIVLLALAALCSGICAFFPAKPLLADQSTSEAQMPKGLQFRLSEGAEQKSGPPRPPAAAQALPDSDSQALLQRLNPLKADESDEQDFALRDRSLPPPLTGKTTLEPFPPKGVQPVEDTGTPGPLRVLRYAPEGEVPLAPHLSITFSQPMVAVTSQEDAARNVPASIEPGIPGRWRWLGTRTLLFEPVDRFPMATKYRATVPAGTRSASGQTLATDQTWEFATPALQIKASYPSSPEAQSRDPLMFMSFDQHIDQSAVVSKISIGDGKSRWRVRLATQQEIGADQQVQALAKAAGDGRWLAFKAVPHTESEPGLPLPPASSITATLEKGAPSAEGPRLTETAQSFSFQTYGALRVVRTQCGPDCRPLTPWSIQFTNPLDEDSFDSSKIKIEPELPGLKTSIYGEWLTIQGLSKGRTAYRVTLSSSIKDRFGQTLGKDDTITFNVGSAEPALAAAKEGVAIIDPFGPPHFSVFTINNPTLKVSLYAVGPENWSQFKTYMRYAYGYDPAASRPAPPGRLVLSKTISTRAAADEMTETAIDLTSCLKNGHGQVFVLVQAPSALLHRRRGYRRDQVAAWVQVTGIGLDAFSDDAAVTGWATSLKDGSPLGNVHLSLFPAGTEARTDGEGMALLPLTSSQKSQPLLLARKGDDLAILPQDTSWWNQTGGWSKASPKDSLRWYVFDDRGIYKPGEEVHVKGWIRRIGAGITGDVGPASQVRSATYSVKDAQQNEIAKGSVQINVLGGFDTSFKLPGNANLGYATLEFDTGAAASLDDAAFQHRFQIQEFRRPEFEVTASASDGPHFVGGSATATVSAQYYAGGPLPDADVTWRVTATPGNFTPPNHGDFTFGEWTPWWNLWSWNAFETKRTDTHTETFTGRTDASGKHLLRIDMDSANPARPYTVSAEATVFDVNRQGWTARTDMLVHPADMYVGIRSPRTFVQPGQPLVVQSIVTDLDGKLIPGRRITMRLVRQDWTYKKGQWQQNEVEPQDCSVDSGLDPVECRFEVKRGGQYRVTATIEDDQSRKNQSSLTLWVAGGPTAPSRNLEQEQVTLIPDRKEYQPGDTAEILVQSPWPNAHGVLTLRRSGLVSSHPFHLEGSSTTLKIPIEEAYLPNLNIQVDLVGAADRSSDNATPETTGKPLPKRPAFASGSLDLAIPPRDRTLTVKATPAEAKIEPGGETAVDVEVKDAAGHPVSGSEAAVVVVDEAILALTTYKLDDPVGVFYQQRPGGVGDFRSRNDVALANPEELLKPQGATAGYYSDVAAKVALSAPAGVAMAVRMEAPAFNMGAGSGGGSGQGAPISVRENFNPLAIFAASLPTDSSGHASVKVKLPDNLTRYRIMAVSVAGAKQFGSGESAITARLPLMVRPSPPRFLNFGDHFDLPVVVQNQTDSPMQVNLAVRATNADLTDGAGRTVTVPANDRVEVRFPAAAVRAGTARFQVAAVSGKWADAAQFELPVWTPATTEAFATYGEIDNGAIAQPVSAPTDAVGQFGGLEITTSSTELQSLTDAVIYLTRYPYECSEQLASRIMAVAALRDVLTAFKSKDLPKPEVLAASVDKDIQSLKAIQNDDGSFGFWRRGDKPWPYLGIHAAHALVRAKAKGYSVPPEMLKRSESYLKSIESHIPSYYGPASRRALIAYALYVRNLNGDKDPAKARALIAQAGLDKLSIESIGWLLPVLSGDPVSRTQVADIRRFLNNRAEEDSGTAHFTCSYADDDNLLLRSNRRVDGIVLDALITDQPDSDLIPKIVRGLLAHRTAGRWENTQENAFVLLALDRYFNTYEKTTPDFTARAWIGQAYAGDHLFKGRTTERSYISVPMAYLIKTADARDLVLSKDGAGRMYYRIGLQYAPADLNIKPADYGFTVQRTYEAIDDPGDVRRDSDGTWHIKAGATVRVRLTMVAPTRRYQVALVDPLPAGLEPLNPSLAVTGTLPDDPNATQPSNRWWWWSMPWFEHQNMRDDRVEAFTSLLWEGVYNYSYVARATTPGRFVAPPPKAEEMYHPETFGRGGTDRVVVE